METNLFSYGLRRIASKRALGKEGTADMYRTAMNRLQAFAGSAVLPFEAVTRAFVERYAVSLHNEGLAVNSVNSYLSCFRAIYNAAVEEEVCAPAKNPFFHLRLKRQVTPKRALPVAVMQEVCRLELSNKEQVRALDLYIFSFLACGMPVVDMAHLTRRNIMDGQLVYNRHKTGIQVRVGITREMQILLSKYADADSPYLFPMLRGDSGHEVYKSALAHHNACLREIGSRLSRPVLLTSYVARHSWATEALRQNIPIAVISQALGHTSEKTTRCYLDLLDQSELIKANEKIVEPIAELVRMMV